MLADNRVHVRVGLAAIMFVLFRLAAGMPAGEIKPLKLNQLPAATKILSFPSDQCTGNLYLEPESGPGWDPKRVTLSGQWQYLSAAQGDVHVPEDRNVQLSAYLALGPRESAKLRVQNPLSHRLTVADRVRKDPDDLSGLSELDPNDLFRLSVGSMMYLRTGADPRIFEPISRLTGLQMLSLNDTGVTDKGLEHLRLLRSLRALELRESSITSRGLAVLMDLPALVYLDLYTGVTDAGLKQVAQHPNLRWLRIRTGNIWGPGLAELANLPRLERLCIWGTSPISNRHLKYMEGLTQLKSLTLWGICSHLTDASLASIGKLKNLEELYFIRANPRFTPAGAAYLKHLKDLKKLDFAQAWLGPEGSKGGDQVIRHLAALPNLESIKGIGCLSAEGMKTLTRFRNLKCLHVTLKDRKQGYYGPAGLSYLTGNGSLEELLISSGDVLSEADLACLEPLGHLKELNIMSRHLTERGMASISKLKRLEKLTLFCPVTCNALNQLNGLANLQHLQVNAHRGGDADVTYPADELTLDLSGLKKIRDMSLSGLQLQDSDLAFLEHPSLLENLSIQPDGPLDGTSLRHVSGLPELNRLFISQLSDCTDEDLAHLNNLSKLRDLTLTGGINESALSSLEGLLSLWSLRVETDEPIRQQTVTDLTRSNPAIEYIHINELPKFSSRPAQSPDRTRTSRRDARRRR